MRRQYKHISVELRPGILQVAPDAPMISAITPLKRDPNLRQIRVAGKVVATLRGSDVESLRLKPDMPWTERTAASAFRMVALNKVRNAAMKMLGRRALAKQDLIDRLIRAGHDSAIAQQIADELEIDHWLNDVEFARSLAEEVTRRKPASQELIAAKLQSRKIDCELAQRIAVEVTQQNDPLQSALQLAKQRLLRMKSLPAETRQRRIAGMLGRRGFDDDLVSSVIEMLGSGEVEDVNG